MHISVRQRVRPLQRRFVQSIQQIGKLHCLKDLLQSEALISLVKQKSSKKIIFIAAGSHLYGRKSGP